MGRRERLSTYEIGGYGFKKLESVLAVRRHHYIVVGAQDRANPLYHVMVILAVEDERSIRSVDGGQAKSSASSNLLVLLLERVRRRR